MKFVPPPKPDLVEGTHGVIVVHGIGYNQKPGEFLAMVANPLADALQESSTDAVIEREMDASASPARSILRITSPSGEHAVWQFREAFWADAFPQPEASSVLEWMFRTATKQVGYIVRGWRRLADPAHDRDHSPSSGKAPKQAAHQVKPDADPGDAMEDQWKAGRLLSALYSIELLAVGVLLSIMAILLPVIQLLLLPLYWLPTFGPLETFLKWLHFLDPFLSRELGDMMQLAEHGLWSASARGILEKIIIDMMNDGEIDDITIIAYSGGCLVTYDALSAGGKVAQEVGWLGSYGKRKKLTLVTLGSAINHMFSIAQSSRSSLYARQRFSRPLAPQITGYDGNPDQDAGPLQAKFFWLDICGRFDPVPAGFLDPKWERQASVHPEQVKRRQVVNEDNPARDHFVYWDNKALVMPRLARAVNGGECYPWPEAGMTQDNLERHYKRVAALSMLRLAVVVMAIAGGGLWFFYQPWVMAVLTAIANLLLGQPWIAGFLASAGGLLGWFVQNGPLGATALVLSYALYRLLRWWILPGGK